MSLSSSSSWSAGDVERFRFRMVPASTRTSTRLRWDESSTLTAARADTLMCGDFTRYGVGCTQCGTRWAIRSSGLKDDSVFTRNWWSGLPCFDFLDFLDLILVNVDAVSILDDGFEPGCNKH